MTRSQRRRWRRLGAVALVGALAFGLPTYASSRNTAAAFPIDALSFGSNGHGSITRAAIRSADAKYFGVANPTPSMSFAMDEIALANEAVDIDQFSSAKHFDGENFAGGKSIIIGHFNAVITLLSQGNPSGARISLGAALHTIQDFYAHSNWVELGNVKPNPNLWNNRSIGTIAGPFEATCDAFDGSKLITTKLTSGYYGGEDRVPRTSGKCRHGGPTDLSPGFGGINKDFNTSLLSPHFQFHAKAADQAKQASQLFIDDIALQVGLSKLEDLLGA
jgi:hypothetical protein